MDDGKSIIPANEMPVLQITKKLQKLRHTTAHKVSKRDVSDGYSAAAPLSSIATSTVTLSTSRAFGEIEEAVSGKQEDSRLLTSNAMSLLVVAAVVAAGRVEGMEAGSKEAKSTRALCSEVG